MSSVKFEIAENLVAALKASTGVTDVIGERIFPLYGPEETPMPFVTYTINTAESLTKDNGCGYDVMVALVFGEGKYTDCIRFEDVVKEAVAAAVTIGFMFQDDDVSFDDQNRAVVSVLRFTVTAY